MQDANAARTSLSARKFAVLRGVIFLLPLTMLAASQATAAELWQRHTVDNQSRGADGVRLADTNCDGLLDVTTGWEEGGVIRVYQNPGPKKAKQPWPAVTVGQVKSPEDAVLADLDGDGALDVVSSCEGNTRSMFIHWAPSERSGYLNSGAWRTTGLPATEEVRWMFALPMDLDGRGELDLVVGSKGPGAMIGWLQSPADPRSAADWQLHKLAQASWIMSLVAADMDDDGDLDVLATNRKPPTSRALWLENPGAEATAAGKPWEEHVIGGAGEELMFLDRADVNGDGHLDVLAAARDRQVLVFLPGDDARSAWTTQTITFPERYGTAKSVRAVDVNLDGELDLVITCENANGPLSGVLWMSGRFDGSPWQDHDIGGPEGVKYDLIEMLDLDADGDLDLLTCEERDNLGVVWYENPTR